MIVIPKGENTQRKTNINRMPKCAILHMKIVQIFRNVNQVKKLKVGERERERERKKIKTVFT